ncbi:MAG: hypothetical protein DLM70_03835, partial [Chloroflexi bacterium]
MRSVDILTDRRRRKGDGLLRRALSVSATLAILSVFVLPVRTQVYASAGLPDTTNNVHLGLVFNYNVPTVNGVKQAEIGSVDYVWAADGSGPGNYPNIPGTPWHGYYIPWSQDNTDNTSRITWFQQNHPDWLLYRSDRTTLAWYGGSAGASG